MARTYLFVIVPRGSPLTNVGTAQISHDVTFIDPQDYADTDVYTVYFDVTHTFSNDDMEEPALLRLHGSHKTSWGFTALYPDATVFELRSSLIFEYQNDGIVAENIVGLSYRREDLDKKHAFFDETFDFRDMIVGPTPDDRIAPAVENPLAGVVYNTDEAGNNTGVASGDPGRNFNQEEISVADTVGVFFMSNIEIEDVTILLGARYDKFDVEAEDIANREQSRAIRKVSTALESGATTFSSKCRVRSLKTFSANSLNANQLGGVIPASVPTDEYLAESELAEIGFKFLGFDDRIYAALTYYDQEKTERSGQLSSVTQTFSKGVEFELRALITDQLSIIATATHSEIDEIGNIFTVINGADFAAQNGLTPDQVYGGRISADRDTLTVQAQNSSVAVF